MTLTTAVGASAFVAASNATAIGARARADQANALVLGSIDGVQGATSDTRVGIGTTTPDATLEIESDTTESAIATRFTTNVDEGASLVLRKARGTSAAPSAVLLDDVLGTITFGGFDSAVFVPDAARIMVRAADTWSTSSTPTRMIFAVTPSASTGTTNNMILHESGRLVIGSIAPNDRLSVFGDIRIGTTGSNGCLKNFNNAALTGTCSSDARFKRDIAPFTALLDRVAALRPVHYLWRTEAFPEKGFGSVQAYGLIAQDVEQA